VPDLGLWLGRRFQRRALRADGGREAPRDPPRRAVPPWKRWLLAIAALLVAGLLLTLAEHEFLSPLTRWFASLGAAAPITFILLYIGLTVALVPNSFLTVASGALFGFVWGTVYSFVASVLGAAAAFLVSRYLLRDRLARRMLAEPRFQRVDRAICRRGLRVVLLIRLSPVLPFSLLNYVLGLSHVRLRDYLLGSISMLPGTALYVYPGMVAGELIAVGTGRAELRETAHYVSLAAGLALTAIAVVLLTRTTQRALREETAAAEAATGPG